MAELTEDEMERLVMSLATTRENGFFTEEEAAVLVKWANDARTQNAILDMVLAGVLTVDVVGEEVLFKRKG